MPTSGMYRNRNDINLNNISNSSGGKGLTSNVNGVGGSNFRLNGIEGYQYIGGFGANGMHMPNNKINPFAMIQEGTDGQYNTNYLQNNKQITSQKYANLTGNHTNNNNMMSNTQNTSNNPTTVLPITNYIQYQQQSPAFNINKNLTSTNNITNNSTDRYMTNPTN